MKIEFYTDTVKKRNEDIYGITRNGAFVLDGAPLPKKLHIHLGTM